MVITRCWNSDSRLILAPNKLKNEDTFCTTMNSGLKSYREGPYLCLLKKTLVQLFPNGI